MDLIVYLPGSKESGSPLLDGLKRLPPGTVVEVFESRPEFIKRLRRPHDGVSIAVLFDPSREDLDRLRDLREFLDNVHILLVLSDQDPPTMALAHRLLPSFITYVDSDIGQLLSVIRKLLPAVQEAWKY